MSETSYVQLKNQIQELNATYIRLSGQIEQLTKQEQEEMTKIQHLDVVDIDKAIADLQIEIATIQSAVDYSLKQLETVS